MPVIKKLQKNILGEKKEIKISFNTRNNLFEHDISFDIRRTVPNGLASKPHQTIDSCIDEVNQIISAYNSLSSVKKRVILIRYERSKEAYNYVEGLSLNFYYILAEKTVLGEKATYNLLHHDPFNNRELSLLGNRIDGHDGEKAPVPGRCIEIEYNEAIENNLEELIKRLNDLSDKLKALCTVENLINFNSPQLLLP